MNEISLAAARTISGFANPISVGDTMKNNLIIVFGFLAVSFSNTDAQVAEPTIQCQGNKHILILPQQMQIAVNKFNPRFKTWESEDYVDGACVGEKRDDSQKQAPFALIVDANKDGKRDIILDGHDEKECLLICVLSQQQGYAVVLVKSQKLVLPQKIVSYREGKKCNGLLYHFSDRCIWTSEEHFDKNHTFVFQRIIPQQSDSRGNLLFPEGGSISYYFENGKFVEGDFDPL